MNFRKPRRVQGCGGGRPEDPLPQISTTKCYSIAREQRKFTEEKLLRQRGPYSLEGRRRTILWRAWARLRAAGRLTNFSNNYAPYHFLLELCSVILSA